MRDSGWQDIPSQWFLVLALPDIKTQYGWSFQFNALAGRFEHVDPQSKKLLHVYDPTEGDTVVYEVSRGKLVPTDLKVTPVEVVELKVPVAYLNMEKNRGSSNPAIRAISEIRAQLVTATEDLNSLRKAAGLAPLRLDKGKRSSSRKDLAGGLFLWLESKFRSQLEKDSVLEPHEFHYNPETGYWVDWQNGARFVYHPQSGVFEITSGLREFEPIETRPIYFRQP